MGKYATYDRKENLIFVNLENLHGNSEAIINEVIDEAIAVAKSLPNKVYVISCWKNTKLDPAFADHFGKRAQDLQQYVLGIVRYNTTNLSSNIAIRAQTIKHNLQGTHSNIFETREEALEAIHNKLVNPNG